MAEYRRIFYVAITRCKDILVLSSFATMTVEEYEDMRITYSNPDWSKKRFDTRPCPFVGELGPAAPTTIDGNVWQAAGYGSQVRN